MQVVHHLHERAALDRLLGQQLRHARSRRVRWLDLYNVLGIVTLVWALCVANCG